MKPIKTHQPDSDASASRTAGRSVLWLAGLLVSMVVTGGGCQHGDTARRANRERVESLQRTVATWSESEARRPSRARRTAARIPVNLELHAKRLDLMIQRVRAWQTRKCERWQERQPAYRHQIERRIHGKPEQIEPVAILLFL